MVSLKVASMWSQFLFDIELWYMALVVPDAKYQRIPDTLGQCHPIDFDPHILGTQSEDKSEQNPSTFSARVAKDQFLIGESVFDAKERLLHGFLGRCVQQVLGNLVSSLKKSLSQSSDMEGKMVPKTKTCQLAL